MKPILFSIGHFEISSYSFLFAASFFVGACIFVFMAKQDRRAWDEILEILLVIIFSALFGAKIFHVLFEAKGHILSDGSEALGAWQLLQDDPWHWAGLFDPGYVFYGGLLVSLLATFIFVFRQRVLDPLAYGDYAAFALVAGIFLGRLGCFLEGCCFGSSAGHIPWAVTYQLEPLSKMGPVHPTQLYDAAYGVWAGWWLNSVYRKRRFSGEVFLCFLLSYSVWRYLTEFYRGDEERGIWFSYFSTSQLISLILFLVSFVVFKQTMVRSSLDNKP